MRPVLLTREYPPEVYGGAGVHVEYLARELGRVLPVEVRCFGAGRDPAEGSPPVRAFEPWAGLGGERDYAAALRVLSVDLAMTEGLETATLVHSHTWYANFAGHLAKVMFGLPHVVTTHSFEPHRPWKVQQLGTGGYALSSWCERIALEHADAVIAVSGAMRDAVLELYEVEPSRIEVIHNGIDPDEFRPDPGTDGLLRHGVDPGRPYVLFVGRISRQKGIDHLLAAVRSLDPAAQFVLCAGSADTAELREEVARTVEELQRERTGVVWLEEMVPRADLIQLITHAAVLAVPSVYEPLGIVNLEAMACETAVVASAVGGIPEVVVDGETGLLVPYDPADPAGFRAALASRIDELLADPGRARELGAAGRRRVLEEFAWRAVADRTVALYRRVAA